MSIFNSNDPPPPPAGLNDDLDNDLNDALAVMDSLNEQESSRVVTIHNTNDWVRTERPPIEINAVEEGEETEEEDETDYSLTDEVPTQILQ